MRAKRLLLQFSLLFLIALFSALPISEGASNAASWICSGPSKFGRADCHGYFTNRNFEGTYGIQGGDILDCTLLAGACTRNGSNLRDEIPNRVNDAASFEDEISWYLGASGGYTYNRAGAAFIIDTMLGRQGSSLGSATNAINYARANLGTWKTMVTDYENRVGGTSVQWNVNQPVAYGDTNSLHSCVPNIPSCQSSSEVAANDGDDFIFYRDNVVGGEPSNLIIFHNANGTTFAIRRQCANLVGNLSPLTPTPPPKPTCAGLTVDPGEPDPKMTYTVTGNVSYQNNAEAKYVKANGGKMFIDISGPGVSYNNANVGYAIGGATLTGSVTPGPTNNTGTYNIKYGITGTGAINCTGSFYVTDQPTTTTTGGDTEAGLGMTIGGVDCSVPADPKGGMVGWNLEAAGNYAGAGTQYAAFALNHLQDYATAQDGAGGTSSDPAMLGFANNAAGGVNVGSGLFGGNFGGSGSCVRDYFANATGVQTGNITIGGQAIANGTSKAVYVKGNVYITGNITFSGSYANIGDIPSYNVIVEGNIYIAPNVTQLDGLYVAEPTSATVGGTIYTCAPSPFTAQGLTSSLYNNCHANSLTFNGAVVARQLRLLRAGGTVSSNNPAESVNFTPEIWLTTPPDVVTGNGAVGTYDAITSLPPVL